MSASDPYGILLAAGGSTRMGRPKALFPVRGVPLVRLHEAVLASQCRSVRVVLGAYRAEIASVLGDALPIVNERWAGTGPRESLLLALDGLRDGHVVITPVDVPPVDPGVLARLIHRGAPAAVGHRGEPGHPVLVEVAAARSILAAGGTLKDVVGTPALVEGGRDAVRNLNTPEEWTAWTGQPVPAHLPGFAGVDHVCPRCGEPVSHAELQALFTQVLPAAEAGRVTARFHRDTKTLRVAWACGRCVDGGHARFATIERQDHRSGPPIYVYADRVLRCGTCGADFLHSAAEQQAFYEVYRFRLFDGPSDPRDCPGCRFRKRSVARAQRRLAELRSGAADPLELADALRAAGSTREWRETLRRARRRTDDPELRARIAARIAEWDA